MNRQNVDERVVSLELENEQFESRVENTIKSLGRLTNALNLEGAADGLTELEKTANGMNFGSLLSELDEINNRFNVVTYAVNALVANLTNKAVDAAERFVKSLSVDQVAAGWNKYNQQLSYVQTIMNATGKSVDEVDDIIAKLAWFSDETSFSLNEMMSALSTAAASGADLEKVIPMIEGIATATAYAGKSGNEFVHVIRNIMQSYSSGYLSLMDWKSVELMQVNSKQLEQTLIDTAVALGKLKEGQVTPASFRDSLKDKWIDTEVMEQGFSKFSVMMEKAYKLINAGMFEQASEAIEYLSDKTQDYTEAAQKLVASGAFEDADAALKYLTADNEDYIASATKAAQSAKTFGEMVDATADAVSTAFSNIFKEIFGNYDESVKLWTDLANFLWDVLVPPLQHIQELLANWKDYGGRNQLIDGFVLLYEAASAVIKPIREVFREFIPKTSTQDLINFSKNFKAFAKSLKIGKKEAEKLKDIFRGVFDALSVVADAIMAIVKPISTLIRPILNILLSVAAAVGRLLSAVANGVNIIKELNVDFHPLIDLLNRIQEVLIKVRDGLSEIFKSLGMSDKISAVISTLIVALFALTGITIPKGLVEIFDYISGRETIEAIKSFIQPIKSLNSVGKTIVGVLDEVREVLKAYQTELKARAILKIAIAVGALALALKLVSTISKDDLTNGLSAITIILAELMGFVAILSGFTSTTLNKSGLTTSGLFGISSGLLLVAIAVAILAGALRKLAVLNPDQLAAGLFAITVMLAELTGVAIALSKTKTSLSKGAGQLILLSVGVLILSRAVERLGNLDFTTLIKGLGSVAILLIALGLFANKVKPNKMRTIGVSFILISTAMLIFAKAISNLAQLDVAGLAKGLGAIVILLTALGIFVNTVKPKRIKKTATAMVLIGASMLIFAKAISNLAQLDVAGLAKGLGAIVILLTALGIFVNTVKPKRAREMVGLGVGLILIGAALAIIAKSVQVLGALDTESLIKGLLAFIVILGGAAAISEIISPIKFIAISAGLLIMAAALTIITGAILALAAMASTSSGVQSLTIALLAIVAAFAVLGVAAAVFAKVGPELLVGVGIMMALAVAVALVGAGLALAGAGIVALSGSLGTFVAVLLASAVGIGKAISLILLEVIKIIPELAKELALGFVSILQTLEENLPQILESLGNILTALIEGLIDILVEVIPEVVSGILNLIIEVLDRLISSIGTIIAKVGDLILAVINGIADWLDNNAEAIYEAAKNLVLSFINAVITILTSLWSDLKQAGIDLWDKFKEGASEKIQEVKDAVKGWIDGIIQKIKDKWEDFKQIGIDLWNGFKEGVEEAWNDTIDWFKSLPDQLLGLWRGITGFDEHSPSKKTHEIGEYAGLGLYEGVMSAYSLLATAGTKLSGGFMNSLSTGLDPMNRFSFTPSINLDTTGLSGVSALLNGNVGGSIKIEMDQISSILTEMKSMMNIQNELLSGIKDIIASGGNVYLDGNVIVGYVDRKLGASIHN